MAKPRIFVSSTYYDLKYIRASLEIFVDSLGFEAVLSEKGDIAYTSDRPLDESCYREAENADIFVLIVGGRYGSEVSADSTVPEKKFFDRYDSITKKEYETASEKDVPIYVLIEKGVYSEYQTFGRNKDIKNINYAHVDSVNVFHLIEDILAKPRNNPVHTFEKFEEIEIWLREQWSGMFRELLRRQSQQQQLTGLSQQVLQLKETNETLKKYMEAVMRGVGKNETSKLIESEEKRLKNAQEIAELQRNQLFSYVQSVSGISEQPLVSIFKDAGSFDDFASRLNKAGSKDTSDIIEVFRDFPAARRDMNQARRSLGLSVFSIPSSWKSVRADNDVSSELKTSRAQPDKSSKSETVETVRIVTAVKKVAKKSAKKGASKRL